MFRNLQGLNPTRRFHQKRQNISRYTRIEYNYFCYDIIYYCSQFLLVFNSILNVIMFLSVSHSFTISSLWLSRKLTVYQCGTLREQFSSPIENAKCVEKYFRGSRDTLGIRSSTAINLKLWMTLLKCPALCTKHLRGCS